MLIPENNVDLFIGTDGIGLNKLMKDVNTNIILLTD